MLFFVDKQENKYFESKMMWLLNCFESHAKIFYNDILTFCSIFLIFDIENDIIIQSKNDRNVI